MEESGQDIASSESKCVAHIGAIGLGSCGDIGTADGAPSGDGEDGS